MSPIEPLDDEQLSLTALDALEVAASRGDGRPLGTLDILLGVLRVDVTWGWESVQVESGFVSEDDLDLYFDPDPEARGKWHDFELTGTATDALAMAGRIAAQCRMLPLPGGVLVLGLLSSPTSAASRALLDGASIDHSRLLGLIQQNVLDTTLDGVDLGVRRAATGVPEWLPPPDSAPATGPIERSLSLAHQVGGEEPGALALLAGAVAGAEDPDLADLLLSMLLDGEGLAEDARHLRESDDVGAEPVLRAAGERGKGGDDTDGVIVATALSGSKAVATALRERGLSSRELAGQVAEWGSRRGGRDRSTTAVMFAGVVGMLATIVTSLLLLGSVVASGAWWQLVLLFVVWWTGYPAGGPLVGGLLALLLFLLAGPIVGVAQVVNMLLDVGHAWVERRELWAATGVKVSLREQRNIVCRLLTPRARRMQSLRQLILANLRLRMSG
jgi:hypothetical protein